MRRLFGRIPGSLDFRIELCSLEVIVITEHTERMLGKELCGRRSFLGVAKLHTSATATRIKETP